MKLFISWSGERSEAVAKSLYERLTLMLHYIQPWLSKSDIQAGDRWSVEVAKGLEECNFGIICVTKDNLHSDWILFEAGALAKSMQDGRVVPLLLDLDFKDISGPLAQFQAKKADIAGVKDLVVSLNKAASTPVLDGQLETLFELVWPRIEEDLAKISAAGVPAKHTRTQGDILEELVASVRGMEMRFRDAMDDEPWSRKRRRLRHPMALMEMLGHERSGESVRILMLASMFREDAPWIFELGRDFYYSLSDGKTAVARAAGRRLMDGLEAMRRMPLIDNEYLDRAWHFLMEETTYALRELDHKGTLKDATRTKRPVTRASEGS